MAPAQEILKRQRSRPSDWWAVQSTSQTTPSQQDESFSAKPAGPKLDRRILRETPKPTSPRRTRSDYVETTLKPAAGLPSKARNAGSRIGVSTELLQREVDEVPSSKRMQSRSTPNVNRERGVFADKNQPPEQWSGPLGSARSTEVSAETTTPDTLRPLKSARLSALDPNTLPREKQQARVASSNTAPGSTQPRLPKSKRDSEFGSNPGTSQQSRRGRSSNTHEEVQAIFEQAVYGQILGGANTHRRTTSMAHAPMSSSIVQENVSMIKGVKDMPRDRRFDTILAVETAVSSYSKKPKARVTLREKTQPQKQATLVRSSDPKAGSASKKRRREPSLDSAERPSNLETHTRRALEQGGSRVSNGRGAKSHREIDNGASQMEGPLYQQLTATTRQVSRQTIEDKWQALPQACVGLVSQMLGSIQQPVVVKFKDDRQRVQASTALQMVSRRLVNKIAKGLPFPNGARANRECDFDFEKVLDQSRIFESSLTPALHANELLEVELKRETTFLESDQASLRMLLANAKAEAGLQKTAERRQHALLQQIDSATEQSGFENVIGLSQTGRHMAWSLDGCEDEELQSIFETCFSHTTSITSNMKQIEGIVPSIIKGKAAVRTSLLNRLGNDKYEEVILG